MERRGAVAYLVVQAVLALAWWAAMALDDGVRAAFELDDARPEVLDAFFLADLVVFVGGSLAAAAAIAQRRSWSRVATAATAGGAAYATLHLVAWVGGGGGGGIGIAPMAIATAATAALAIRPPA